MHSLVVSLSLPLLLALAVSVAAQDHAHHAVKHATPPVPAQRWKTDAPLREGMGRIRVAVGALQHDEHGHMDGEQVARLADGIQRDVAFIVTHCNLEPRADATLHPILGTLAQDAQALKANPADLHAIPPMRRALADYARLFDDPGVSPVAGTTESP